MCHTYARHVKQMCNNMCSTCETHYKICPPNHGVTHVSHMCNFMCQTCVLSCVVTCVLSCDTHVCCMSFRSGVRVLTQVIRMWHVLLFDKLMTSGNEMMIYLWIKIN